jgi:anaerobic ribonucleoside-triphosphate reductase
MIPGNRPEDAEWEEFYEKLPEMLEDLSIEEAASAVRIGVKAIMEFRSYRDKTVIEGLYP